MGKLIAEAKAEVELSAPQLSAGNTILLKHAGIVPQSAAATEKLMREAGLPEGAFKNLYAAHSQIALILNHPLVRGVALCIRR